jgi:RecB family exonuclease
MRRIVVSPLLARVDAAAGALVVLPNRQAARSLGLPYRSLEGLAARVIEEAGLRLAPKLIARRLLTRAVREVAGTHDPTGLARVAEPTVRELLRAGVDLGALQAGENERVGRLARIGTTYLAELRRRGLVDPAELLWRAAERATRSLTLCVAAFPRLPAAERELLDALAGPGSTVHLPVGQGSLFDENRQALSDFRARGWTSEESESGPLPLGPNLAAAWAGEPAARHYPRELNAYAFADLEAEARGTLASVKRLLSDGVPASRIALVARDEAAYGPTLLAVADEYRLPLRALYQVPLTETRLGAWVGELLDVLASDYPFEGTARLLVNPLANVLGRDAWQAARLTHPHGREQWSEYAPGLPEAWPERAERSEFCRVLARLLNRLGVRGNAVQWAREAMSFQAFSEGLRALPDPDREIDAGLFAADVNELLTLLTVPVAPGRGGVELHTPLSLFGARVDHLFVLGMAEGSLPSPVRLDPLLDPFERDELSAAGHEVETVTAAARREELSFWALLQCAGASLTLSYPKLAGRSETLPSPYLARLGLAAQAPPASPACSLPELRRTQLAGEEAGDAVLAGARHALAVESAREGDAPADGYDGLVGAAYRPSANGIGVSRLIDLANCPFKFYAASLLRLAEPEEAAVELEASLRGNLYHRVLHLAMAPAQSGADPEAPAQSGTDPEAPAQSGADPEAAAQTSSDPEAAPQSGADGGPAAQASADPRAAALSALEASFEAAEDELGLTELPGWQLEREQHLQTLRLAVSADEFMEEGARVRSLEAEFRAEWRGIPVRGRVDRIDETPAGLSVLDYKSGTTISNLVKDADGRPKVDLQLPVYREATGQLAPGEPVTRALYYSVTKAKELKAAEAPDEELGRIAGRIREAWREGAYPVDPDLDEAACRYCQFDPLCRRGPRIERKRNPA